MVTHPLYSHLLTPCSAVKALTASVVRQADGSVWLRYQLVAELGMIRFPQRQATGFADGLWEHTCFEAFIGVQGDSSYHEFNFSPSGQWAAYAFSAYRESLAGWSCCAPLICFERFSEQGQGTLILDVVLPVATLPANPANNPWQLGLTAVIETVAGEKSYWALEHPTARPDFHHRGGFVVRL